MMLWADEGPNSQGKILTAALRAGLDETGDELGKARHMLRAWSPADLADLDAACIRLRVLIGQEQSRRRL